MKVERQNYYVQKKSAFKVDGTLRIETVRTTLDFAYRMTFSGEGQHRIHRSGGEHNRRNGEIFANAYQGKLAEFAACNYFCRFDKTIKPDLTIMKLGKWDSSDLSLNGCEISVKSTKKYGQLLLLETRDWTSDGIYIPNEGHGTASYDCILLIRMECYAKGRLNSRTGIVTERGWWETEIIVSKNTTSNENYPEKDVPFYVITDDGWKFMMHVSGDYSKNFESHGDLKILGYWLKGRLVASGFIDPVDSPAIDLENVVSNNEDIYKDCKGVITYQKLLKYGRTSVSLTKTLNKLVDDDGIERDVWVLSFLPSNVQ